MRVGPGDAVEIGGFIITGNVAKKVIVRAIGPSLVGSGFSSSETLQDPVLDLYDAAGRRLASNDDWQASQQSEIESTGVAPGSPREAAIVAQLSPGNYTSVVSGASGGLALVEVYDLDQRDNSALANISTRGRVAAGDDVMIAGFILGGRDPSTIVVRALGPSLAPVVSTGTLENPSLTIHDAFGATVAANDDWREAQRAELEAVQLGCPADAEAAVISSLPPGSYTAVVRGHEGESGIGLVEVYRVR